MKLGDLMSMFSLSVNDSQSMGRRIFRRPYLFMRHRARRMEPVSYTHLDVYKRQTEIVATVRESLSNYRPKSVIRVFIPKAGSDKMRPLGIPCIWDRLVQRCV